MSAAQAARDLGVGQNVLNRWVCEAAADAQHAFPGQGQMKPDQAELKHLKHEIVKLKAERDILLSSQKYRRQIITKTKSLSADYADSRKPLKRLRQWLMWQRWHSIRVLNLCNLRNLWT